MAKALQLRSDIANAVFGQTSTADEAVGQLQGASSPSGLKIDAAADFAYAAIDVGQRLLVLHKPADAEKFFQAAEQSLASLVSRTADTQAKDKAQFLRKLSYIRGKYLNEAAQAQLDIAQALTLQPGDKDLLRAQVLLGNSHAPITLPNSKG